VTAAILTNLTQNRGGFARRAAKRGGALRFLDIL